MADVVVAVIREFGWQIGVGILLLLGAGITIRVLASRIERLYDKRIEDINTAHEREVKRITEGHANEVAALRIHSEKGWSSFEAMRVQADRLAEKYGDTTQLAQDMADELLDRRRSRRARGG